VTVQRLNVCSVLAADAPTSAAQNEDLAALVNHLKFASWAGAR
jgi:hypothetical protein